MEEVLTTGQLRAGSVLMLDDAVEHSEAAARQRMMAHMPAVDGYQQTLRGLGEWWQKVTLIGKINSLDIAPTLIDDMEFTKRRFEELQVKLIDNLVYENLRKVESEVVARSQVAIDILIRNLFERTADVGFLATDDDLRAFLADEPDEETRRAVVERLREYTLKYSVYDEIVVLDTEGRVRAHLDEANPIERSEDPLIGEALATHEEYLEVYRWSDLRPGRERSLIYACRIQADNQPGSPALGVLCLCFRFDDEMAGIFANLARRDELIAILDGEGRVLASSDPAQLPLESRVAASLKGVHLVHHGNRDYLARTSLTNGYQGYTGQGWRGHVMVPVASAFVDGEGAGEVAVLGEESRLFSKELRQISHTASMVTDDLILVVLNGQIISAKRDAAEFMPVLDEIRNIGNRTQAVFDTSLANLHDTVLSSLLGDVRFQAFLAVDIMDRNLYERANDARWWALTTRFRELLAAGATDESARATIRDILVYINNLYTVYTNLMVYDTHGTILAVSNPAEEGLVGSGIGNEPAVQAALQLRDTQQYRVSNFAPTALYGGRHTYVYHAAISAPGGAPGASGEVVGGIGIVFDGEPQFRAMLDDALPRDANGALVEGAFGLFCDRERRVIAATELGPEVGERCELDPGFFALANGERTSAVVEYRGRSYAVGAAMSQGYREYKTTGDYDNDVVGLVFVPI